MGKLAIKKQKKNAIELEKPIKSSLAIKKKVQKLRAPM